MYTRQQVLDWVNEQRENVNAAPIDRLIQGYPEQWDNCPVANTFEEDNPYVMDVEVFPETRQDDSGNLMVVKSNDPNRPWGYMSWNEQMTVETVALPLFVTEFTKDFDNWQLPDLIAD